MLWWLQFTLYDWKSSDSLVLIGPSWSDFSLALVLFSLYECVCNNSLKPYHGEIIRPCYSDGHYRSTTCIASSLLISQNGCWGAHQESCFVNCMCVYVCACLCVRRKPTSVCVNCFCLCLRLLAWTRVARVWARTCTYVVLAGVCMHVEWHLAKCGSERRNIWLIIEVPWKKYDHESVLGLRAQL